MNPDDKELVERIHRQGLVQEPTKLPSGKKNTTIHYQGLPEARPEDPLAEEWNTFRNSISRLLAEGFEGHFLLIKNREILGVFQSWELARKEGLRRFFLEPFLVQEIRDQVPNLRHRGLNFPWPN